MIYTVSITSQGQISIPVKLRRKLGLDKKEKALVSLDKNRIIVEPVEDLLSLKGSFKTRKRIPFKKIHAAFGEYLAREAVKGMK